MVGNSWGRLEMYCWRQNSDHCKGEIRTWQKQKNTKKTTKQKTNSNINSISINRIQLSISKDCVKLWIGTKQAMNHHTDQRWRMGGTFSFINTDDLKIMNITLLSWSSDTHSTLMPTVCWSYLLYSSALYKLITYTRMVASRDNFCCVTQ